MVATLGFGPPLKVSALAMIGPGAEEMLSLSFDPADEENDLPGCLISVGESCIGLV